MTVSELSKLYKVTEETIRRDLDKLEAEGFLTRSFGGAVLNNTSQKENIQFYKRAAMNQEEKKRIASLISDILSKTSDCNGCQYNGNGGNQAVKKQGNDHIKRLDRDFYPAE